MSDIKGRALLQLFGDTVQTWEYAAWVRNYITVKHAINEGKYDDAFSFQMCTYYIREADSTELTEVVLKDVRRVDRVSMPDDTRIVWWDRAVPTIKGGHFRYPTLADQLCFYYSPSLASQIPPPEVIDAPLTLEALKSYTKYYIEDREGYRAFRAAQFSTSVGTLRLHDLRHHGRLPSGRYGDLELWGISRGEGDDIEVYDVNERWMRHGLSSEEDQINMMFQNQYPLWGRRIDQVIKLIGELRADYQED